MILLAFETSCDETSVALVKDASVVLAITTASSLKLHEVTKGIIPESAARKQIDYIGQTLATTVKTAFPDLPASEVIKKIDAIAVTTGPGLIGSLLVGVEFAKTLAYLWNKPIIPVNHLVAHIYAAFLDVKKPTLPALALVVSGGHSDFVLLKDHGRLTFLGGTRDDAAGEAFDKCARLLDLPYPGGPSIAKAAENYLTANPNIKLTLFPRPLLGKGNLDMSFSGLKTSVLNYTKDKGANDIPRLAAEVQEAIVDTLVAKTLVAIDLHKVDCVIVGGGVSANSRLKEKLTAAVAQLPHPIALHVSQPHYATDNAAVIATCAFYNNAPRSWDTVFANPQLAITDLP